MQSLLCAIGIGASEALPLAATLNWVIKDGLGQLGGVIFASVVSSCLDIQWPRLFCRNCAGSGAVI
jgi:Vitamin B6 photo-protection and homoeostasis